MTLFSENHKHYSWCSDYVFGYGKRYATLRKLNRRLMLFECYGYRASGWWQVLINLCLRLNYASQKYAIKHVIYRNLSPARRSLVMDDSLNPLYIYPAASSVIFARCPILNEMHTLRPRSTERLISSESAIIATACDFHLSQGNFGDCEQQQARFGL